MAAGTIIQMPQDQGCGPGKYAVVESLDISQNQTLQRHLSRRANSMPGTTVVHDLNNQESYWNHIIKRPSSKKSKHSIENFRASHKRWLEEEWRDDAQFGDLSKDKLHKR
ncbi:hypothetical protein ColLi_11331 [Colletotrichum liriopes]|uniref:Uncharacterized protein n=1 Tax=Colletotrichum liriopes TaxID=708192 RepID=A0AA37GYQ2_9PEZI|nr:hypothetical protein ColLi_11331 [Colletotrichum liriopes]